jgi:GNAT superfamily N-acetyltransferase
VGRAYHWVDRLVWSEERWRARLQQPGLQLHLLSWAGAPAGYYELEPHGDGSVEIAYFGLLPEFLRRGLGGHLLTAAVEDAWRLGATNVWLHTCTLDGRRWRFRTTNGAAFARFVPRFIPPNGGDRASIDSLFNTGECYVFDSNESCYAVQHDLIADAKKMRTSML